MSIVPDQEKVHALRSRDSQVLCVACFVGWNESMSEYLVHQRAHFCGHGQVSQSPNHLQTFALLLKVPASNSVSPKSDAHTAKCMHSSFHHSRVRMRLTSIAMSRPSYQYAEMMLNRPRSWRPSITLMQIPCGAAWSAGQKTGSGQAQAGRQRKTFYARTPWN
jgi:hypothetical protein